MARSPPSRNQDVSEKPLADFFWVAGLDSQDLLDAYRTEEERRDSVQLFEGPLSRPIDEAIQEDAAAEDRANSILESPIASPRHSRQDSYQRLSRLSDEARNSVQSIDRLTHLSSTRSSATARRVASSGAQSPGIRSAGTKSPGPRESTLLSDVDFENALVKFAKNRDTFYLDLNFKNENAGTRSKRAKPTRPRTQKIVPEELDAIPTPNRTFGTVRRHMSFRDMNSNKRQPSVARRLSTKLARRVSSYNSVLPNPQPFQTSPNEHPLKRTFEPVLLDRYPRREMNEELKRRGTFPDYVPMFAFPNDINIVSSDSRPATTWHEFNLTAADNSKTPAVCVIIWIPLDRRIADELEKRCEDWRRSHMPEAERELAASLAERLAQERAKLSRLLAQLPSAESGTAARDELEEQISTVEEKISLMSDMLKPLRHGAASRIEGLTVGDSGLWIPRAYGILGSDQSMTAVWKEWLKAVIVPMMDGGILHVPASSPRVGMWQPLERYVYNICCKAPLPLTSKVQVELGIRELRLYAKKEAANELPGSRSADLYPLFRALTIPNILVLFEYLLAESRVILVSAHTSMLKLASKALLQLLWPLEWTGVYVPVLPSRLMQVLEAPIPYICGVVRRTDRLSLPEDEDFVMVDLDKNELHATAHPPSIPKQQRRKLMSLLYLAAPHQHARGVPIGPPAYAVETFPSSMFVSENTALFAPIVPSTNLAKLAGIGSTQFGQDAASDDPRRGPILNAFSIGSPKSAPGTDRPMTANTARQPSIAGSDHNQLSPVTGTFPPLPGTPRSRNDSGFALQASLREKRSGHFDSWSKRSPSIANVKRKGSMPFMRHNATPSNVTDLTSLSGMSNGYASSTYAQSTLAASTIMPGMTFQPARNTETLSWVEGHRLNWRKSDMQVTCSVCNERTDDSQYRCSDCPLVAHARCASQVCVPCSSAFYPDQVRAAFARFFTSLFYNYRRFMQPADQAQRKSGLILKFNVDAWIRSLPPDHGAYMETLKQTQSFTEMINERETKTLTSSESIALFDALMAAKRGRSKGVRSSIVVSLSGRNPFAGRSPSGGVPAEYLSDGSAHLWRVVSTPHSSERPDLGPGAKGRDYRKIVTRTPARLEDELFPLPTEKGPPLPAKSPNSKTSKLRHRMNGLKMNAP